jgi:hypothetical protein
MQEILACSLLSAPLSPGLVPAVHRRLEGDDKHGHDVENAAGSGTASVARGFSSPPGGLGIMFREYGRLLLIGLGDIA